MKEFDYLFSGALCTGVSDGLTGRLGHSTTSACNPSCRIKIQVWWFFLSRYCVTAGFIYTAKRSHSAFVITITIVAPTGTTPSKGLFIATQLNSTQLDVELSWVELSCVAIGTLTDATQLSPTIGNATDPVEQRTANQRETGHGHWRLWSTCHINRHVFSIILLTFLQIFHSNIPSPGKLVKTRHIWRHDLQTESTGSRRSELLIGDSCSRCERVDNSTSSRVELSCVAINGP